MTIRQYALRNAGHASAPDLADAIPFLSEQLAPAGAAAVFVVRLPLLGEIEREYGHVAFEKVAKALSAVVERYAAERFQPGEYMVAGVPQGGEVVVVATRPRAKSAFSALPKISQDLMQYLEGQRSRITHPYGAERASFAVGFGIAIHNPSLRADRRLLLALESAREDAELNARMRKRETGLQFLGVVLDEEIRCVYQPILSLSNGTVIGYEALARGPQGSEWQSPLTLFKLAEEQGLTYELDCLCRKSALRSIGRWTNPNLKLFLNCLPAAIHDPNFAEDRLRQTLEASGLTPSNLVLEISERESIKNFSIFREARERYRNLGMKIALDDTGAGYAGLEAVMELAPDFIKVDISLVRSVDTDAGRRVLLKALKEISDVIGARLIAEGIETEGELQTLCCMEVPYGQGFLLGRPESFEQNQNGSAAK